MWIRRMYATIYRFVTIYRAGMNKLFLQLSFRHIRALGFLYLRYVCKPSELWSWFEPYLDDEEEIQIQGGPRPVVMYVCCYIEVPQFNRESVCYTIASCFNGTFVLDFVT